MAPSNDAIDARLPPLPIGRLSSETLRMIGIGRLVHVRTGPWVLLEEDGSRVVRIHDGSESPPVVEPQRLPAPVRPAELQRVVEPPQPPAHSPPAEPQPALVPSLSATPLSTAEPSRSTEPQLFDEAPRDPAPSRSGEPLASGREEPRLATPPSRAVMLAPPRRRRSGARRHRQRSRSKPEPA